MKILRAVVAVIALGVLDIPRAIPPFEPLTDSVHAQRELAQLQGMSELKSWFNGYKGRPRLILLLSPT
jgi:hypothetical protein